MRTLIEIGADYGIKFLPACWEKESHWLRRRSWKRAVLAWAVLLALGKGML